MAEKRYESTFIIKGSLQDTEIDQAVTKFEDFITKNGGTVIDMERWGRRKLAYEIGKETSGAYVSAHFTSPSNLIARLERAYHLDESIIRWLTLVMPETNIKGRLAMKKRYEDMTAKRESMAAAQEAAGNAMAQQ